MASTPRVLTKNNKDIKEKVKYYGDFNNWKGYIGLYFNKKELREIAKEVGIKAKDIESYKLVEVYRLYTA